MDLSTLGGGGIKTIQRGLVSVNSTVDITVSAVNISKSTLNCIHFGAGYSSIASRPEGYAYIFNETKIRFYGTGGFNSPVSWELIEYE